MRTTSKTINAARAALRRGDAVEAQALLTRAAASLGMTWLLWSSPMPALDLTRVALELIRALDPETEPQVSDS